MIQRIQTVYLLLSIILLSIVSFGTPIFYLIGTKIYEFTAFGVFDTIKVEGSKAYANYPLYLISLLAVVLQIVAIFSFKDLKRQGLLVKIAGLLNVLIIAAIITFYFMHSNPVENEVTTVQIGNGFYLISLSLIGILLANNGIKRDKKLIDSLNRLR